MEDRSAVDGKAEERSLASLGMTAPWAGPRNPGAREARTESRGFPVGVRGKSWSGQMRKRRMRWYSAREALAASMATRADTSRDACSIDGDGAAVLPRFLATLGMTAPFSVAGD